MTDKCLLRAWWSATRLGDNNMIQQQHGLGALRSAACLMACAGLMAGALLSPDRASRAADPRDKTAVKTAAAPSKSKAPSKKLSEAAVSDKPVELPSQVYSTGYSGSYSELIGFINEQIRQGWKDNNVAPSAP